jgi:hypothetical protein
MKKTMKFLTLLMVFLLALPCFAACDGGKTEITTEAGSVVTTEPISSSESEIESETEYFPNVAEKNYDADFFLSVQPDSNYLEYHWVEESSNDVLSQAIYTRQQKVSAYLGVNIVGTKCGTSKTYIEPLRLPSKIRMDPSTRS